MFRREYECFVSDMVVLRKQLDVSMKPKEWPERIVTYIRKRKRDYEEKVKKVGEMFLKIWQNQLLRKYLINEMLKNTLSQLLKSPLILKNMMNLRNKLWKNPLKPNNRSLWLQI